jgi:integrase
VARLYLTDVSIRALKPTGKQHAYWCTLMPNFGVMVSQAGGKSFFVMVGKERRRIHLGKYPATSLKDARGAARQILLRPQRAGSQLTLGRSAELYLEAHVVPNCRERTAREVAWYFAKYLVLFKDRPVADITTADLSALIVSFAQTPALANNLYGILRTFFRWLEVRTIIEKNPLTFPLPYKKVKRDRVLSDAELISIHRAAEALISANRSFHPYPFIVLFCIYTGMRRNEVASLKWSYITHDLINLPPEITKNGESHSIPKFLHKFLRLIPKNSEYLFHTRAGRIFNGWSANKVAFDRMSRVSNWVIHDLRRTFATKLADWQFAQPHVIERLLNHSSGSTTPLARVYNRATYLAEMRAALLAFEAKLASLLQTTEPSIGAHLSGHGDECIHEAGKTL